MVALFGHPYISTEGTLVKMPKLEIELDWRAYFDAFCHRHGEPVPHGGRLLFPDCWAYSATSHAGPEWPPPLHDEGSMRALATAYWRKRRATAKAEAFRLRGMLAWLAEAQETREIPLKRVMVVEDESTGKRKRELHDLDLDGLRMALDRAVRAVEESEGQLESLKVAKAEGAA